MTREKTNGTNGEGKPPWGTKEKILLGIGAVVLFYLLVAVTSFHQEFHVEFLILVAAMFGLSIAGWGDKK